MKQIYWYIDPTVDSSALRASMTADGYQVTELNLVDYEKKTWVFPKELRCVLIDLSDMTAAQKIAAGVRKQNSLLPIVGIYDPAETDLLGEAIDLELDDLVPSDASSQILKHRMVFRDQVLKRMKKAQVDKESETRQESANEIAVQQREEFLSICAHDLRSPLGLISSSLQLILNSEENRRGLSPFVLELLNRVNRQASQGITLVNDLLDVMSYEQGLKPNYSLVEIEPFLSEFYEDYRLKGEEKGISVHFESEVKGWKVLMDTERIRQLLQNLFTNAVKFTESGKNIRISVKPFVGRRSADPPFPMLVMSVSDEGPGIPAGEIQKIFDRFSQLKDYSRSEGRGLGLTVAKQISQTHGGNVWVESIEGQGSTFHVLLPHVVSHPKQSTEKKTPVILAGIRESREVALEPLNKMGKVSFLRAGTSLLAHACHSLPDAILLTSGLSQMAGTETVRLLKADPLTSKIPVIFLCEDEEEREVIQGENLPCDGLVLLDDLKALEQLLGGILSPSQARSA